MRLRLLADENIDGQIVRLLVDQDVFWVAKECPGILDPAVMALALARDRTLVTADKLLAERFARSREHSHLGLIFLRLAGMAEAAKAQRLLNCMHGKSTFAFVHLVIKKRTMRERSLPLEK